MVVVTHTLVYPGKYAEEMCCKNSSKWVTNIGKIQIVTEEDPKMPHLVNVTVFYVIYSERSLGNTHTFALRGSSIQGKPIL